MAWRTISAARQSPPLTHGFCPCPPCHALELLCPLLPIANTSVVHRRPPNRLVRDFVATAACERRAQTWRLRNLLAHRNVHLLRLPTAFLQRRTAQKPDPDTLLIETAPPSRSSKGILPVCVSFPRIHARWITSTSAWPELLIGARVRALDDGLHEDGCRFFFSFHRSRMPVASVQDLASRC